jgi:outer membrane receptor for ferrienterochelin and colicins
LANAGVKAQTGFQEPLDPRPALLEEVEVRAPRLSDLEQRRLSNAVRTIVGRDEIERYGDTSLEDILRRQPGVTVPAGGGNPRLRGMSEGYTQILIDGQPAGRGFSLEGIAPEQVQRIEITRVPTADTGSQAIAGTVNVITREGIARGRRDTVAGISLGEGRLHGLRLGLTQQGGWVGDGAMMSLTVFGQSQQNRASQRLAFAPASDPEGMAEQASTTHSAQWRRGLSLRAQRNWTLAGDSSLSIRPMLFAVESSSRSFAQSTPWSGSDPLGIALPFREDNSQVSSTYTVGRLMLLHKWPLPPDRLLETSITPSVFLFRRQEAATGQRNDLSYSQRLSYAESSEGAILFTTKLKRFVAADEQILGLELEQSHREEQNRQFADGTAYTTPWGQRLGVDTTRWSAFGQWDHSLSPYWSLLLGARHEETRTALRYELIAPDDRHAIRQTSPSLTIVYRPGENRSEVYRASINHAYKAVRPQDISAVPRLTTSVPPNQANTVDTADTVGNPLLKPEQSWGVDFQIEKAPWPDSLVSVGLFWKRLLDVQRRLTQPESVPWSPAIRWVNRPRNLGQADLIGLELEAKGRTQGWRFSRDAPGTEAPLVLDIRGSFSRYWSRLHDIDGPENGLPGQPEWEAKLSFDARPARSSLRYGVSLGLGHSPPYSVEPNVWISSGDTLTLEAYGVYAFDRSQRIRISLQDIARRPIASSSLRRFTDGDRVDTRSQPGRFRISARYEMSL